MQNKIEAKHSALLFPRRPRPKGKRSLEAELKTANQHLHELLDQLSVISLGCFTLRGLVEEKMAELKEFDMVEAAVGEGAALLEKLNQSLQSIEASSRREKSAPTKLASVPSKIYPISLYPGPQR